MGRKPSCALHVETTRKKRDSSKDDDKMIYFHLVNIKYFALNVCKERMTFSLAYRPKVTLSTQIEEGRKLRQPQRAELAQLCSATAPAALG